MERREGARCSARCRSISSRSCATSRRTTTTGCTIRRRIRSGTSRSCANKYGRTRAAVLNLSGWNDDNYGPEGAITNYLGLVQSRARETVPRRAPARPLGPRRRRDRADEVRRTRFRSRRRHRLRRGRPRLDGPLSAGRPHASDRSTPCGISSWATTSGGRRTPGRLEDATASTTCRQPARRPARRRSRRRRRREPSASSTFRLRSGRSGDQSVRVGRRARLPAARGAPRRADVRFGAARSRTRT